MPDLSLLVHLAVVISIYGILAISMNLIIGTTGLFTIGHAAFFGIGAYTSAILTKLGIPWVFGMLAGIVLAGLIAFLIGIPTLRLVGDYLAVVTLGLAEIMRAVFKNWIPVTRGPMGLPGIPHAAIFGFQFRHRAEVPALECDLPGHCLHHRRTNHPLPVRPGAQGDSRG